MGMYTQLHFGVQLKKDTPTVVVDVLKYMLGDVDEHPKPLPRHRLFSKPRWPLMLQCDSYYFDYKTTSHLAFDDIAGQWWFNVTSNFKNYDDEIAAFVDWVMPFVDASEGEFLGYSRYEETEQPSLIFADKRAELPIAVDAVDPVDGASTS